MHINTPLAPPTLYQPLTITDVVKMHDSTASEINSWGDPTGPFLEFKEDLPPRSFTVKQLDEIVAGDYSEVKMAYSAIEDHWLLDALSGLNWWVEVATYLVIHQNPVPERAKPLPLLNEALSSYTAALAEGHYTERNSETKGCPPHPATMEFMKRYRLYTVSICATAQRLCPDADLEWLLNQA
jgi:hypothetical protein